MKVKDVMIRDVKFCHPDYNLAQIAEIMWNGNCGAVPVVDDRGKVTGMITDRDICIALGTRNAKAADLRVGDVASARYFACAAEDDLDSALRTMAAQEVRRLPVVDADGRLTGILSIDDVILRAGQGSGIDLDGVLATLQAVCRHRPHERAVMVAAA